MPNLENSLFIADLQSAILRNPLVVTADTLMMEAIAQMSNTRMLCINAEEQQDPIYLEAISSCVLVIESERVVGIITERDVVRLTAQQRSLNNLTVREVMVAPVVTLQETEFVDLLAVVNLFQQHHIRHIPIVDQGDRLLGIVTHESLWKWARPIHNPSVQQTGELHTKIENEQTNIQISTKIAASFYQQARMALIERQRAEAALKVQSDFNQLIAEITSRFVDVHPNKVDEEINHSLQLIGEITQVDTSYIFQYDDVGLTTSMTYEWCNKDIPSQIALAQNIPSWTLFPWSSQILMQRDIIYIPNVHDLPAEAAIDQANWQQLNLASILMIPLVQKSVTTGAIGFSSFSQPLVWDDKTVRLLQVLGQTIINAQVRSQDANKIYESEERLRLALKAANQGLYDLNLQTGQVVVSQEYATMLGYDHATFEETNAKWIARLHPDDREAVANVYQEYVAGNLPEYKVEFRQHTHSGEWKWILSLGKIVEWDEAGHPIRMLGTHTDIHERKQAENSIAQLAAIIDSSTDAIISKTLDSIIVSWNAGAERLLGYTAKEVIGQSILLIIPPEFRDEEIYIMEKIKCGEPIEHFETIRKRKDGSLIYISLTVSPIKDTTGKIIGASKIARDISDRKQAEAALRQLNQELEAKVIERTQELWKVNTMQRAILDSADYSFISTDPDGIIQTFNAAAEKMLGYTAYEVIGKVTPAILHDRQEVIDRAASLSVELNRDIPVGFEVFVAKARLGLLSEEEWTYIRKDGSRFPILLSVTALKDANQQITGFLGIAKDISEQQAVLRERKQAEAAIKESEVRFRYLADYAPVMIWMSGLDKLCFHFNKPWLDFTGRTMEEEVAYGWEELLHPEDRQFYVDTYEDIFDTRQSFSMEYRHRRFDGQYRWLLSTGIPRFDAEGEFLGYIGSCIDISDRKQAEEQLQESKAELERFFSVALDLLCIADLEGYFCRLNRSWETTLGYPIAELEGQKFLDFVHPDDLAATIESMSTLSKQETVIAFVNRYRCKNGTYRYIEWYSRPYGNSVYAAARDITNRKQTEAALRESEHRFVTLAEASPVAIFRFDTDKNCIYINDRWSKMTGRPIAEGLGHGWVETIHPHDRERISTELAQWFPNCNAGDIYENEARILRPDGSIVWYMCQLIPETDSSGITIGYVGTLTDISDRKQAEITIQQTAAQLEASNRELEAFAYSVSHDLRAPLRAIDGFSNALMEDYGDKFDEDGRDYFERIRRNIQRMGMLIDDLLRLSRVSRSEMQYSNVKLSALVQEQIHDLQESDSQRQVEVIIAPDVVVCADITLIRVVISNLVQNAWKFTSHHATARIEFGVIYQEKQPVYFVRDDGAGFDMKYSKMLFGVFHRLHNTNEFPGTGIGLATVQRVIHRHGGKVWADGEVEKGATIYFTVPNSPIKI